MSQQLTIPPVITPPLIAELLGCGASTVRRAAREGALPEHVVIGGSFCWPSDRLEEIRRALEERRERAKMTNGVSTTRAMASR